MWPAPPFLRGIRKHEAAAPPGDVFPLNLSWLTSLELSFRSPVVFFVGENGSGKSTLLEAIAELCGLPVSGGSRNEIASGHGTESQAALGGQLRPVFTKKPRDGYFLRAELLAHFASLLDERRDGDFGGNPYARYGGKSLHQQSHGEAFLAVMQNRLQEGIFFLDEPEAALSPQRQLTLLALLAERVRTGKSQFVIATHSPILLTFPEAQILSFDSTRLNEVPLEETSHYHITKGILDAPQRYWKYLIQTEDE